MLSMYPACFCKEEVGYSVFFPDLNWLTTCGDNLEDAMSMAIDCLAGYLYDCKKDGEPVPEPSEISSLSVETQLKEIYEDSPIPAYFINIVSVDVASYAKEHFEKSVKKTLTIPAWLNKAALEHEINFSQVLQEALLSKIQSL